MTIASSPDWLKTKLGKQGLRPINNVVDITNFVLLETGQPLHAFDASKITDSSIVVRNAEENESITTLDGIERKLDPTMMVIADSQKPLVIAGIMGSMDAEVDECTSNIVLESAWFNPGKAGPPQESLVYIQIVPSVSPGMWTPKGWSLRLKERLT